MKAVKFILRKLLQLVAGILVILFITTCLLLDWFGVDAQSANPWVNDTLDKLERWYDKVDGALET